jgi:hypothetical protein
MTKAFKLFGDSVHAALVHAATDYDRKEEKKRYHNIYALSQYLERIAEVERDIERGATVRAAILAGFSGRLCDVMLRAVGEKRFTKAEDANKGIVYQPASE